MESRACEPAMLVLLKNMHLEICLCSPSLHKPSLRKDWNKMFKRSISEGLGFATTTLPNLGKSMIESFKTGRIEIPTSFKRKKGTCLPMFYNGLFSSIYDTNGVILSNPNIESIRMLNQLCFMFYKYETGYTSKQLDDAVKKYCDIESELKNIYLLEDDVVLIGAKNVINKLFKGFDPMAITPHISNGALATGEIGADKFVAKRLYSEIHRVYPYYRYFVPTPNSMAAQLKSVGLIPNGYLSWYKGLKRLTSGTSKLFFVNKDSRGPRSISMEPSEYQYIQQGLKDSLCDYLERKTRNQINFRSQKINQDLAIEGSLTGNYNTYDFSSASDRVSVELVNYLFRDNPRLLNALHACRSTHTELPDGSLIKLKKFAPMGSALCFPVMATVIYAIAKSLNTSLPVRVYGDDLILEDDSSYVGISHVFKRFGLVLNNDKSFTTGLFRESCGADAFAGHIINPIRIKKDLKCKKPEQFAALVDSSNEFYKAGYWHLAGCLRQHLQQFVSYPVPTLSVYKSAPGLSFCYVTDAIDNVRVSIDRKTCLPVYETRTLELRVPKRSTETVDEFGYMIALQVGGASVDDVPSKVIVRNHQKRSKIVQRWRRLFIAGKA